MDGEKSKSLPSSSNDSLSLNNDSAETSSSSLPSAVSASAADTSSPSTRAFSNWRPSKWQEAMLPFKAELKDFELDRDGEPSSLEHWRKYSLVLNASRRFRYTSNLQPKKFVPSISQLRVALNAVERFKLGMALARDRSMEEAKAAGFGIGTGQLDSIVERADAKSLRQFGWVDGVLRHLKTDAATGLSGEEDDIAVRQRVYGTNTYPEKEQKSFLSFVWDALQDVTLIILMVAALVSLVVGILEDGIGEGWYDGAGVGFSILLVVLVTATSDYRQSLQFLALDREKKKVFIQVLRGGQRQKLSVFDIVVGDIILVSTGDIVPADGLYISGNQFVIDESSMTGESEPVKKSRDSPFLLSGTKVQDGDAVFVATGVGMHTEWGHLMAKLSDAGEEETPLQVRLSGVATLIGRLGLIVAAVVFFVLMLKKLISVDFSAWSWADTLSVIDNFAVAVTIVVVAVPEGLPLAVTLSLAYAMQRMMRDKALVRKLAACETMGSVTTICSDKTGTLTANQMTVVRALVEGNVVKVKGEEIPMDPTTKALLLESIFINTSADVQPPPPSSSEPPTIIGSPTDSAIVSFALSLGGSFQAARANVDFLRIDPFNSKRKRMAAVVRQPEAPSCRVFWKGAAEIIAASCTKMIGPDGSVEDIDPAFVEKTIADFASDALRTLSIAYRDVSDDEVAAAGWPSETPAPDNDLVLLAIVGIKDPLRAEVPHALELCHTAGIKVRMVTGDNLTTAKAIARECGILTEGGVAIEGPQFRELSPEQMREIIPKLQVMARSSPTDKNTLVRELRAMGEVVAVTGDGTNDAPALKEADIGLAMGVAGTEVAKESADVVILDDNFSSIVNVAKWGRCVYTNMQKFVQFQLTVNIVALSTNFICACITGKAPLTDVQLLWVNLIMDTLGALALATEPPKEALMLKPPAGRRSRFVTNIMWRNIAGQSIFQLVVLSVLQFGGKDLLGFHGPDAEDLIDTITFNTFVFCQVFNEINCRDMEALNVFGGVHLNAIFVSVLVFTVSFQTILVQYLGKFASTVPLTFNQFMFCVMLGSISIPLGALVKLIPVPPTKPLPSSGVRHLEDNDVETPLLDANGEAK